MAKDSPDKPDLLSLMDNKELLFYNEYEKFYKMAEGSKA